MTTSPIVNAADAPEIEHIGGKWGHAYKVLTPSMRPRGGKLGVSQNRLPPGKAASVFHHHLREDEVFYILSGRGVLRYGDELHELVPGDCVSCPAGTGIGHQIANPYDEELVYLAMGPHDPHEVCFYPDTGKIMVRGAKRIGVLQDTEYMAGEGEEPKIFELISYRR